MKFEQLLAALVECVICEMKKQDPSIFPEYASVEDFVQFLIDEERETYTHEDLTCLHVNVKQPVYVIRRELDSYGLKLSERVTEKNVRGFTTSSNDRWYGPGSSPTHGGAGIDPETGRATVWRKTI